MMPRKYLDALIVGIACVVAVYAGSHLVLLSPPELGLVTALVFMFLWTLTAGDYWWAPVLTGATITGIFYVGFKIYPLEVALGLGLLGLAPLLMVRNEKVLQGHRRPLPLIFYLAAVYITLRMMVDIFPAQGSRGTLLRIYFNAIWPFVFGWLFYQYGKTPVARAAVWVVFIFLVTRAAAAIVGYVLDIPLYIPGINYVLTFRGEESMVPMRAVAFSLLVVTLIIYHSRRSPVGRFLLLPFLGFAGWLMVMGASRFMTMMFLTVPVCFFAWRRKWLAVFIAGTIPAGVIVFVNLSPQTVDRLPWMIGRSLSGLIVQQGVSEAKSNAVSSDEWHSDLRAEGFSRWTQSPLTFVFGYGVRPAPELYETNQYAIDPKTSVNISANVAAYESGLWTVLAVLGAAGFALYLFIFLHFWKWILPYFLRRPQGTMEEGLIFWGCYSSFVWYATCHFQGGFPSLDLFLMILAVAIVQDSRAEEAHRQPAPETVPALHEETAF